MDEQNPYQQTPPPPPGDNPQEPGVFNDPGAPPDFE